MLDNQVKTMLVCDPKSTKTAASMLVKVGSLEDPIDVQGIAHLTEHMLFQGSEKYPDE